jgi:hypothetical protein
LSKEINSSGKKERNKTKQAKMFPTKTNTKATFLLEKAS